MSAVYMCQRGHAFADGNACPRCNPDHPEKGKYLGDLNSPRGVQIESTPRPSPYIQTLPEEPEEVPQAKPWEETWVITNDLADRESDRVEGIQTTDGRVIVETDSGYYPPRRAEALLIAQAPAAIRLLLAMHESGTDSLNPVEPYDREADRILRAAGVIE